MASGPARKSSREKVSEYRARLRAQGLRPVQIWVPDTRSEVFRAEALRQSRAVATSAYANDDQAFIEAISEFAEE
ncbi:DNA-binding LacI/PurR family transcriptional regulator [Rhizobium aquaticum]|uniref:DNA-binding LacI/PurR family transcriptional regulator n=1 Tax=Rhizobium aquaticum TaxID=1549636 RepID=A0ABV2IWZ2_9HYPH